MQVYGASEGASVTERPTSELQERLRGLSPSQRAALQRRLGHKRGAAESSVAPIPVGHPDGPLPLSYQQELLWLNDQVAQGGNAYNSPAAFRLSGPFRVEPMRQAITQAIGRHEVLRTRYQVVDGEPMQLIGPPVEFELPVIDLSGVSAATRDDELHAVLRQLSELPFDLATDLVIRGTVVKVAADDHVLHLVLHHIASDGWSKTLLWSELVQGYEAACLRLPDPVEPPPVQFADYALWQRKRLTGDLFDQQLAYWRDTLADAPSLLSLPTDKPRPPVKGYEGEHLYRKLPIEVLTGLKALARHEGVTLFTVVLAAFNVLLQRHSGQDDIVVGTPIASRNHTDIERVVGYFTNTLALRTDLSGDPTFRELLVRERATVLGAFAHQEVPFGRVVTEVALERDRSRTPVFQAMLVLQNHDRERKGLLDVEVTGESHERGWSKFDLTLGTGEWPDGLLTSWEYSTDLWEASTIERMVGHFAILVDAILADPDRPLSQLELLDPVEYRTVVDHWATRPVASAAGTTLTSMVEASVDRNPAAVAVECGAVSLTYAEIDQRANQVAHHLGRLGLERGAVVAVLVGRSADFITAVLGIHKAGAVCLPLDPSYPAERLELMLSDSAAPIVLTHASLAARLPHDRTFVVLDEPGALDAEPTTRLGDAPTPADLAYLIYTSGSTGRPRGVELTHQGFANHAQACVREFGLTPADRVLQFASVSFDLSIEEIFPTLAVGATVVMRTDDTPIAGRGWARWLVEQRLTVLDLPTAFWHAWVADATELGQPLPLTLRLLIVGGEKAQRSAYLEWLGLPRGTEVRWINTYGPTEASVIATWFEPTRDPSALPEGDLPIGRPVDNVETLVLDGGLSPVPIGVAGELYLGGVGLARGYHGQPERTAERFVPHPLHAGQRLYRTGDRVRWQPDGTLEFLGRVDHQLKIRGFRVEPGEVEAVLTSHALIEEALVVADGEGTPDARLVAYLVGHGHPDDLVDVARRHLVDRLPTYLVPGMIIALPSFPLTANGKVDRDRLPAPGAALHAGGHGTPVSTETERLLAAIWTDLLTLARPPWADDDFFTLGGHSLLAVRMVAQVEKRFDVQLPLASLFSASTLAGVAASIDAERGSDQAWRSLVPIRPGGVRTPLFLAPSLVGECFIYRPLVQLLSIDQPVYGLQSIGLDSREQPLRDVRAMAEHFVGEIRSVQPHGPYRLGGYCFGGTVAMEMAAVLEGSGEAVDFLGLFDGSPRHQSSLSTAGPTPKPPLSLKARVKREHRKYLKFLARKEGRSLAYLKNRQRWWRSRVRNKLALQFVKYGKDVPTWALSVEGANLQAMRRFTSSPVQAPITLFRSDYRGDSDYQFSDAWEGKALGGVSIRFVHNTDIHHVKLLQEPFVKQLAELVDEELAAVVDSSAP